MSADGPQVEGTSELREALADFARERTDLFIAGVDLETLNEFVDAVRRVDAETVAARHAFRIREMSPHFPEDFQAEEDGLEDAEKLLRGPMPGEEEGGEA